MPGAVLGGSTKTTDLINSFTEHWLLQPSVVGEAYGAPSLSDGSTNNMFWASPSASLNSFSHL